MAMMVKEALEEANTKRQMQIFATDVDRNAIEKARRGAYIENIAADVSAERLKRFFSKEDHFYHISKEVRESIVFAVQNVLSDPPFSSLDLLVCRNLLIYLEAQAQQKLIPLFHYTLKKGGVLFLGTSESVGRFVDLFETVNKKFSMYRKRELESSNEELRSLNEEIHSSNEELQSINEELESSREELQSLNEELATVNSELHSKIQELSEAYGTITSVLDSTQIAILFVDNDLRVKRFTSEAARLINLIDSDVGRPIDHISHHLDYGDLSKRIRRVLETLAPFDDDVRTKEGHWYRMRIMVYRTDGNVIEGAVLTFINIDAQKKAQAHIEEMSRKELQAERKFSRSIVDTVRESLLVLDKDYRVVTANRSFYESFKLTAEETEGRTLFKLGEGQWDIPELRRLLDRISAEGKPFDDYRIVHTFKAIGLKRMALNARVFRDEEEERTNFITIAIDMCNNCYIFASKPIGGFL